MLWHSRLPTCFSGCGGFSEGFRQAGYDIVFANDFWEPAIKSYQHNQKDVIFSGKDIRALSVKEILDSTGLDKDDFDIVVGGPPCQGFSLAGIRRHDDPRNGLWQEFFRIVDFLRPKIVVMENVRGILTMPTNGQPRVMDLVERKFSGIGYQLNYKVLNAADYGVPQIRRRVITIANNIGIENGMLFPPATHAPPEIANEVGLKPYVTVQESIMDLANKEDPDDAFNHSVMNHSKRVARRLSKIPEGGKFREKVFSFVYQRLRRDCPSITLVPGHSAFPVHPTLNRTLTVREAARLQSFPDCYKFFGSRVNQGLQVGNAVPPLLSKAMAKRLKKFL